MGGSWGQQWSMLEGGPRILRDVCSREIQSVHVYVLLCARKSVPAAGVDCGAWGIVCPDASSWVTWDPQPVSYWVDSVSKPSYWENPGAREVVPALRDRFICEGTAAEKIGDPGTSTLVKSHYSGIASLRSSYVQGTAVRHIVDPGVDWYLRTATEGIHIIHMHICPNNTLPSWLAKGQQNEAIGAVHVCVSAECFWLYWSVQLYMCVCMYVLQKWVCTSMPTKNTFGFTTEYQYRMEGEGVLSSPGRRTRRCLQMTLVSLV